MYKIDQLTEIDLGVVQENEATEIQIDVSPWMKKWPDGIFTVNVCRPGEMEPYPANCRVEDGMLYWLVTEGELAIAGNGRCDIRLYQGTVKKKTRIAITRIHDTLPGSTQETPPDAAQGWLDSLNETRAEVESNTNAAKESAAQAAASEEQAQGHAQSAAESANAAKTAKQHAEQAAENAKQHAESAAQDAQFLSQRSAVWVGTQAPPEPGYDLWVNPEGRETELPGGGTYELPTASAEVKGGVKVGAGLQMTGDVLGVKPEGNYELIETINVTDEGIQLIERTTEPDGTNYKFKAIYLNCNVPQAEQKGFMYSYINKDIYADMPGSISAKGTSIGQVMAECKYGTLCGYGIAALNIGTSSTYWRYVTNSNKPKGYMSINNLKIRSTVPIPVGTEIEIWGVRADA